MSVRFRQNRTKFELKKKILTDNGELYEVILDGVKRTYTRQQCIQAIRDIPAKDRNCQTDGRHISMKAGYGNLPVENKQQKIAARDKRLDMLCHNSGNKPDGVNIFAGSKYTDLCTIYSNDNYFLQVIEDHEFIRNCAEYLMEIDEAKVVDYNLLKIETPFGICSIRELSTGLKTVMNVLYLKEKPVNQFYLVNIDECGENILPYLFDLVNNTNIALYLDHIPRNYPDEYTVYVNGTKINNCIEFNNILRKVVF